MALNQIGHTLGLEHTTLVGDVLTPYYAPDRLELSENDIDLCLELYPRTTAAPAVAPSKSTSCIVS